MPVTKISITAVAVNPSPSPKTIRVGPSVRPPRA
jgi:hypothetical protein